MRNKGFHHVAFACRDIEATVKFYEDLMGFPLIHTELGGTSEAFMRHIFFDLGDGSSLAFFDLHGVGEPEELRTDISTGMGSTDPASVIRPCCGVNSPETACATVVLPAPERPKSAVIPGLA